MNDGTTKQPNTALAVVPGGGASMASATPGANLMAAGTAGLHVIKERLNELKAFVKDLMEPEIDFGVIPGTKKRVLLKPGSERLMQLFQLEPKFEFPDERRVPGAEPPLYAVKVRCILIHRPSGTVAGEGYGSGSTHESKYRYRVEWWNDDRSEPPKGEGWEKQRNGSWKRRHFNADITDAENTVLKMAMKRAQIDAVLRVTATSGFFEQDIEEADIDRVALDKDPQAEIRAAQAAAKSEDDAKVVADLTKSLLEAKDDAALKAVAVSIKAAASSVREVMRPKYEKRYEEINGRKPNRKKKDEPKQEEPKDVKPAPAPAPVDDLFGGAPPKEKEFVDPGPDGYTAEPEETED